MKDHAVDVVVEVPRGSRNKYEWDPKIALMRLDRRVPGAVSFPADYGYVRETCSVDGDPLDALVLLEEPTFPGICIRARPVGVCWTTDTTSLEPKLICVPLHDPSFEEIDAIEQVREHTIEEIRQFFNTYKALDNGQESRTDHFDGRDTAIHVVAKARKRHDKHQKPGSTARR
jgi:inorganic pyrophosphatase